MMTSFLNRVFRIQQVSFLLALAVLACLPLALINLLRDADLSLLLPITLLGVCIAWGLNSSHAKKISIAIILLGIGPLILIVRIGGIWTSVFEAIKSSLAFFVSLFRFIYFYQPVDLSALLLTRQELIQRGLGLGNRLGVWFAGFFQGNRIEDPAIRTLVWCLVLWLVAVWAGSQMSQKNRLLAGVFPTTLLLAFVINYTGREIEILWLHLGLLLLLLGLTSFATQKKHWDLSKTDYSESTSLDTLIVVVILTIALTGFSSLASQVSIREIIDKLREKNALTSETQGDTLGLVPVKDNANITGIASGLPRSYLIEGGPELSKQLVMIISTGELTPLPEIAHVPVPRHYWRTLTYQTYTGKGWLNPVAFGGDVPSNEELVSEIPPNYQLLTQSVTFPNASGDRLYWSGTLFSVDVPFNAAWLRKTEGDPLLHSNMLAALASTKSYQAESLVLNADLQALRASPGKYPEWVSRQFLALPDSLPARVYGVARDLTASQSTPYDRAIAIQDYLRTFPYTLEVGAPPVGRDVADYFLFDLQTGYCDYYATTMVVLARAAGLPARLVIGYANGAYDYEHAQYIVTENYAHSWVEIYFTNIGWVEFEPTASLPVIPYEEQNELTTSLAEAAPIERSLADRFASFFQSAFTNVWFPILLLFVCGLLWLGFDSRRLNRLDPPRAVQLLYKRLRRLARPVTGSASSSQTAHAYAFDLKQQLLTFKASPRLQSWLMPAHNEIEQLTEVFSLSLFAPLAPTRAQANDAIKSWSRLRWRLLLANLLVIPRSLSIQRIRSKI